MSKGEKTTSFKGVTGVPLKDAKMPFSVTITARAIKDGKRKRPDACVAALDIWDAAEDIRKQLKQGGKLFAVAVRKSSTNLGFVKRGGNLQALRFVHSNGTYHRIDGFDRGSERTFKEGDVITFHPPTGIHKLGAAKEPPRKTSGKPGGEKRPCERRVIGDPHVIGGLGND